MGLIYSYDYFVNKDKIELEKSNIVFCFSDKNMLYLKSGNRMISINLESLYFGTGQYKSFLSTILKDKFVVFPNYKLANKIFHKDVLDKTILLDNILRIKNDKFDILSFIQKEVKEENYFNILNEIERIFNGFEKLNEEEKRCYKNLLIKDLATNILCDSLVFSDIEIKNFKRQENNLYAKKIEYSDKRALTGRIICVDKFNIQLLPKADELRTHIVSRFKNGSLVNFDYSSFETMLSMYLTFNNDFIKDFSEKDMHFEIAKKIFERDDIDNEQRVFAKKINHAIVYGAGKKTILDILRDFKNSEEIFNKINQVLKPILDNREVLIKEFKNKEYIKNYFGTFIFPQKEYAIYNNYVQSTAADIIVRKIIEVNEILKGCHSKILTSVHDSIMVDMHPNEEFLIEEIVEKMSKVNDFSLKISVEKMKNLAH